MTADQAVTAPVKLPAGYVLHWADDGAPLSEALFTQVHQYLSIESYWARGIPAETLKRAITHSLSVVVTRRSEGADVLAGFARIVSDRATYAYLCDVFVLADSQGQGIAQAMLVAIDAHPALQGLRRWTLMTRDAHALYAKFGFEPMQDPTRAMVRHDPDVYSRQAKP